MQHNCREAIFAKEAQGNCRKALFAKETKGNSTSTNDSTSTTVITTIKSSKQICTL